MERDPDQAVFNVLVEAVLDAGLPAQKASYLTDRIFTALRAADPVEVAEALGWQRVGATEPGMARPHMWDGSCEMAGCRPVFAPPVREGENDG